MNQNYRMNLGIWEKKGLVYDAKKFVSPPWRMHSGITPQPITLSAESIRVFAGFRDSEGISRIGFVDFHNSNFSEPLAISSKPVLDIGRDGCFDDNGMILGDVLFNGNELFMFYVGFQLVKKAKFLAFSGLATSKDNGINFTRVSEAPILGRMPNQTTIGAIHSVMFDNNIWRIWFARGNHWKIINGISYPCYHIMYVETEDLMNIPDNAVSCAFPTGLEYRIGRPKVYKIVGGNYMMIATKGDALGNYDPVVFWSENGIQWERDDSAFPLKIAESESWDAKMLAYPALIDTPTSTLMFYNGNNMGFDGFGLATTESKILVNA